jgi:hypothetical protein
MSSRQIRMWFTEEEVEFVNELAEADGVSFSSELRHLIKLGLDAAKRDAFDQFAQLLQESGGPVGLWQNREFFDTEVSPETRRMVLRDTPKAGRLLKLMEEVPS